MTEKREVPVRGDFEDQFTAEERKALRQLIMRVGDEERQRNVEELANRAPQILSMVEGKQATSAVLRFLERCAKWIVGVGAAVVAVKTWIMGGHASS